MTNAKPGNAPPKLRRRLLACATGLSLILCLATVGLWVRSYWRNDNLIYFHHDIRERRMIRVRSTFGELGLIVNRQYTGNVVGPTPGWSFQTGRSSAQATLTNAAARSWHFAGFGYYHFADRMRHETQPSIFTDFVWVPHWFLALLFAILPAVRVRSIIRNRRRNRAGLCATCGYDLRATPDRCPECGAVGAEMRNAE